jgi:hypothetical protein
MTCKDALMPRLQDAEEWRLASREVSASPTIVLIGFSDPTPRNFLVATRKFPKKRFPWLCAPQRIALRGSLAPR